MKAPAPSELHKRWKLYRSDLGDYMRRWIFRHPLGTLRVHRILRSDEGRDFHDHPFDFTSLILHGGYVEHRPGCEVGLPTTWEGIPARRAGCCCRVYGPGSIVRRRAEEFHRLELVNGPTTSLVVTGPYRRPWGFLLKNGNWQDHTAYHLAFKNRTH